MNYRNSLPNRARVISSAVQRIKEANSFENEIDVSKISSLENNLALLHYLRGDLDQAHAIIQRGIRNIKELLQIQTLCQEKRLILLESLVHYALNFARLKIIFGEYEIAESILLAVYNVANEKKCTLT